MEELDGVEESVVSTADVAAAFTRAVMVVAAVAQKSEFNGLDAPAERYLLYVAQYGASAPLLRRQLAL